MKHKIGELKWHVVMDILYDMFHCVGLSISNAINIVMLGRKEQSTWIDATRETGGVSEMKYL